MKTKLVIAIALAFSVSNAFAQNVPAYTVPFEAPVTGVEINNLTITPFQPPMFGPVLRVTTADGSTRMSIQGDGSIRFEHGSTINFADLIEGDDGKLYVPVWAAGRLLLLEVHQPTVKGKLVKE